MDQIVAQIQSLIVTYGLNLLGSLVIFIVGRWIAGLIVTGVKKILEKGDVDQTLLSFLSKFLYYLLMVLIIIAALGNMGIPTTSVIALLGGATLAVGFALQDSLSNFAAGVMIILLRPYRIGDFIELSDQAGFVTDIQIFYTTLTTPDNKTILIPNGDALGSNITNYSTEALVRLDLIFGIGYEDDILKAKQLLLELVQADERVATTPAPDVIVAELGDNSVNLSLRPYVKVADMPGVTAAMTEQVKLRFDQEGISFPYPQRDVHLFNAN